MSLTSIDYAVTKDVRNNPVVRELDHRRQRELWHSVLVGVLLVLVAVFWATHRVELLRHGYQLEPLQRERAAEEEMGRHLRLEIETLRAPQRIERLARDALNLAAPRPEQTIIIERTVAAEPPARTIVARAAGED